MLRVVFTAFVAVCLVAVAVSEECSCPSESAPVCDTDGFSYNNMCELECAGATLGSTSCYTSGECGCALLLKPVCGTDGHTYGNLCVLTCEGTTLAYYGQC